MSCYQIIVTGFFITKILLITMTIDSKSFVRIKLWLHFFQPIINFYRPAAIAAITILSLSWCFRNHSYYIKHPWNTFPFRFCCYRLKWASCCNQCVGRFILHLTLKGREGGLLEFKKDKCTCTYFCSPWYIKGLRVLS